jgi:hypothetical protein
MEGDRAPHGRLVELQKTVGQYPLLEGFGACRFIAVCTAIAADRAGRMLMTRDRAGTRMIEQFVDGFADHMRLAAASRAGGATGCCARKGRF